MTTNTTARPEIFRGYTDTIRVYLDPTVSTARGGFVWKVEHAEAFSHADRWFETEQEALDHAATYAPPAHPRPGRRSTGTISHLETWAMRYPKAQARIERFRLRSGRAAHRAHRNPVRASA